MPAVTNVSSSTSLARREPRVDVAERPLGDGRAHRQLPFAGAPRSRRAVHFDGLELDGRSTVVDDVAVDARVGAAREQALRADRR